MNNFKLWIYLGCFISTSAFGAEFQVFKSNDGRRASLSNKRGISFFYGKPSWDIKVTEIDQGSLFLRDRDSGETYELNLTETEPNSAVFSLEMPPGTLKSEDTKVEIYSVPPSMLDGKNHKDVVKNLIEKGVLKRKPFLLRVLKRKTQILDIFDKKEDALASYQKYKKALGLRSDEDLKPSDSIIEVNKTQEPVKKKVIDTSTLQSLFLANEAGLESQNQKNAELREVLRKIETDRRKTVASNGKALPLEKVQANEGRGTILLKEALRKTTEKDFLQAQELLLQASDFVPHSENLYLQYGLSLHRTEKFNQSIVVLQMATPPRNKVPSQNYFLGLNFYQLKDWSNAEKYFKMAMKSGGDTIGASAAFYLGNTQLKMGKYDESKASFQYVLDRSKDPKMDRRAEQYIEYGLKQKNLAERRSHRWFIDGVFGVFYDSNVILALDSQLNEPNVNLDTEGIRLLASNSLKYRPYFSEKNELALQADLTVIQTQDTDLGSNPELEKADPFVVSFGVPWTHRGVLWQKGYSFDLKPSYEAIFMDLEGNGKENIINSLVLDFNNTLVMSSNWLAKANYQVRKDDADIGDPPNSDDADAIKFVADFSTIIVLNKDAERYLIPNLGYTVNNANAAAFSFTRIDMGITFSSSIFERFIWTNKLGYYLANYETTRTDNNYSLTSGIGYALSSHWNFGLNFNYQINDSTTNRFRKFQGMTTFSYSY